jgi:hypothetical protein
MLTSLPVPVRFPSVEGPHRCQQDRSHREEEKGGKDEEDENSVLGTLAKQAGNDGYRVLAVHLPDSCCE